MEMIISALWKIYCKSRLYLIIQLYLKRISSLILAQKEAEFYQDMHLSGFIDISEDGKLIPNRDSFYDINGKTIKNEDPDDSQLLEYIKNNYYILLSRGMDGCRVYFTNKKLEAYFKSKIKA